MSVAPRSRVTSAHGWTRVTRRFVTGLLVILAALFGLPATFAAATPQVLVLFSNDRLRPAHAAFERGFREGLGAVAGRPPMLFAEYLDSPAFSGEEHEANFARYLAKKYGDRGIDTIVTFNSEVVRFMLQHELGSLARVPVVYSFVESGTLRAFEPLPPRFVGKSWNVDASGTIVRTIELALRLHPEARRLWVVTGDRSMIDRRYGALVRERAARFESRVTVEYLTGLATNDLLARLRQAGANTVVLTPGYEVDGNGTTGSQGASVDAMTAVSTAPIYSFSFLGSGVVGGYAVEFESVGRAAARDTIRLIEGASPSSLSSMGDSLPMFALNLDWRQVQRWGIDPRAIPAGANILFREPTFLEANRGKVIGALVIFLLQAGLIGGLLLERRRRLHAELDVQRKRQELARASRKAMTAELTGAIAHEINQPLGAILSNADAADLGLKSGRASPELLQEIMADIHRDVLRASQVVKNLRAMFANREVPRERFDLQTLLAEVAAFLRVESKGRGMEIEVRPSTDRLFIHGRRIEILQVMANLVLNAMDAMEETPESRRRVVVTMSRAGKDAVIEIRDHGRGIAPENLPHLFESFFTTKPQGMGLGLSISRTLVEAHEGRISAKNAPDGGAIFCVTLPLDNDQAG